MLNIDQITPQAAFAKNKHDLSSSFKNRLSRIGIWDTVEQEEKVGIH
jgi:hypothetical protein